MKPCLAALVFLLPSAFGAEPPGAPAPFVIAEPGQPACSIVLAAEPGPAARLAALELQYHVLRITGAELAIHSDREPVQGRRILVGEIGEFFRRYFGSAGDPMKAFYLRLEAIACDPANYPPPIHRADGIDWKRAAWESLGTPERMRGLGDLMNEANRRATTDPEKQRVTLWRNALWEWMRQGQAMR